MKLFFLLPYFLTFPNTLEVRWDGSNALQWEDFSGTIDASSEFDAWTWSGFNYSYTWEIVDGGPSVELTAYSFFIPAQSWVKKKKKSDELLEHERLHFDISEMHCRYFKMRVDSHTFSYEVDQEMDSIYNTTFQELLAAQIQYDEESEHYRNKAEQKRWVGFVKSELEKYSEFK